MDMGQLRICDAHLKTLDDGPSYNRKPETQCMPLAALGALSKNGMSQDLCTDANRLSSFFKGDLNDI